ncbi:hypothetical protein PSTG_00540 [Puccinia striiformis f. sp. tritici PST-78]|uniref:Uncharacterized protein n=1 Tax=Puccinia striiformis f. sp. tritici PST-78 TaxID=1165861 RepID=A0A0L0W575_9BASI|nr:hypothetical protein PSTG_00540 [Puccinia striiformis f. sp. tritici PST-78]
MDSCNSLLPLADPEALLCTAAAKKRWLAKILANSTEMSIHVLSTSYPSTLFHTPITSTNNTPVELPFTPSLLRTKSMANSTNSTGADPPKGKVPSTLKDNASSPSKIAGGNPIADHYVELIFKLQHAAAVQLQEEQQNC